MPTSAPLMTVEELRRLPEPTDGTEYELHSGKLVAVTIPRFLHQRLAKRVAAELENVLGSTGEVYVEFGFRLLPEHDARRSDVAFISAGRHADSLDQEDFFGAPDLVVEVLSPSNTVAEMDDKQALCFANGCREFWVVDPVRRSVKVTRPMGSVNWYAEGQSIPLDAFGEGSVAVYSIFPFQKVEQS